MCLSAYACVSFTLLEELYSQWLAICATSNGIQVQLLFFLKVERLFNSIDNIDIQSSRKC